MGEREMVIRLSSSRFESIICCSRLRKAKTITHGYIHHDTERALSLQGSSIPSRGILAGLLRRTTLHRYLHYSFACIFVPFGKNVVRDIVALTK